MSDQPTISADDSQFRSAFAHGTAREVAVQAAVNLLLDGHGPTGKTHIDIDPSVGGSARMLTQHEGRAAKAASFALGNISRDEDSTTLDVIQGTGTHTQMPQVRETKAADGTTLVQAAGLGPIEAVTRTTLMANMTLRQSFDANGDPGRLFGKNCSPQRICDTAILDSKGKAIGIAKTDVLKDSPTSRLLRVDVFSIAGPEKIQTKVGDFHLLERHQASNHTALDINVSRAKHEK